MTAIGFMAETMARDQFEAQLPKIITNILGMYKKEKKLLAITQGLGLVLDVAVQDKNRVLEPLLLIVLQTLYQLVCVGPDQDPANFKNYTELLRCFEILCKTLLSSSRSKKTNHASLLCRQDFFGQRCVVPARAL